MIFAEKIIKKVFDYIIVGQGLAGSCLALQLLKQQKKILVIDEPEKNRASAVAAGLFNPITGKRLTKSWKADRIFPYLFQFYQEAEVLLGQKFFYPQSIYQPFISVEEQNDWMARSESRELKNYISSVFTSSVYGDQSHDEFGGILINQTGYLDTNTFMNAVRNLLKDKEAYCSDHFDRAEFRMRTQGILYKNREAERIIFCEGISTLNNPFFCWVPIIPLKGETLTISLEEKLNLIFNRGIYLVPARKENQYLAGATYKPASQSEEITSAARTELENKIRDLLKISFQINDQNWGIRPSTPDRRPVLGAHPLHKNVIIFNGLGTKGVSLAPYFSGVLADWLAAKQEIEKEINIERFKTLYSKFSFALL